MKLNKIYQENCLDTMSKMEDESINMVMTSPPYWALRDYGTGDDQLGLEPTFDKYISNLCDIFNEVKRVLRKDGTCWINLGDTYSRGQRKKDGVNHSTNTNAKEVHIEPKMSPEYGVEDKCLTMIPFRFAIEMVNRGWILRNTIIWKKNNCMPSSAKDRFTVDYEYLFFFVKNKKYWFEQQLEPIVSFNDKRVDSGREEHIGKSAKGIYGCNATVINSEGRNKRTVWHINSKQFKDAHFAVYPEELCETPIKAGCPEFICKKCGIAREKLLEYERHPTRPEPMASKYGSPEEDIRGGESIRRRVETKIIEKGLTDCGCNAGFEGGIVYDPFAGSGTTCLVAHRLNRNFIGSEISKEYCKIAEKRLAVTKQEQFA